MPPLRPPLVDVGSFDAFETTMPSAQNIVDLLPGWRAAFPPESAVTAGIAPLFDDLRIRWCLEQFGPLDNRSVLELGPLEGSHTYMLDRAGTKLIDAVEGNKLSFLRCLVAKEVIGIPSARFRLGDFVAWLAQDGPRYDLLVASGVLYHMHDPVRLLALMAGRANSLYLWTHYVDDAVMPPGDPRRLALDGEVRTVELNGLELRLHKRSYWLAWLDDAYCGGSRDEHYWLEKDQIVAALAHLGFADIRIAHDDPTHVNGPSCSIFARRVPPET